MKIKLLRRGSRGALVRTWQTFLGGQGIYRGSVDGDFGPLTDSATRVFQGTHELLVDGRVGNDTWGRAMLLGLQLVEPAKPLPKPSLSPLGWWGRRRLFGAFAYEPAPTTANPEGIRITDGWAHRNITTVLVPQLSRVQHAPRGNFVQFNKSAQPQLRRLFEAWERAGLLDRVLTWGGSFNPRFIRGSRKTLSNHAWGTAFDINVQWNPYGARPASRGERGSVIDLVPLAEEHGFYWGGHFKTRPDGMHFEVAKIV